MTVKCLDEHTKNFIAAAYREGVYDTDELAEMNDVSKRTINRVCVELGVNKVRVHRPRTQLELPISMEPSTEDIQIAEVPAPTLPQPQPSFIARLWAHVKFGLSFPFK